MLKQMYYFFVPFAQRNLQILFWARVISVAGSLLSSLAIPLYVYHITQSGQALALTALCEQAGAIVGGFFLAGIANRYSPRRRLIGLELFGAVLVLGLLATAAGAQLWIGLAMVGLGICRALYVSTSSTLVRMVEQDPTQLRIIEARFMTAHTLLLCVVPALGGALLLFMSIHELLLLDILSYGIAAALYATLRVESSAENRPPVPGTLITTAITTRALCTHIAAHPALRVIFCTRLVHALTIGIGNSIYVFHLRAILSGTDADVAWLLSLAFGAGVLGALLAERLKTAVVPTIMWSILGMGMMHVALGCVSSIAFFIFWYAVSELFNTIYLIHAAAHVQSTTSVGLVGRLRGFLVGVGATGSLLSMLAVTIFLDTFSTYHWYQGSGYFMLSALSLIGLAYYWAQFRVTNNQALGDDVLPVGSQGGAL